jgi:hypothetical protein
VTTWCRDKEQQLDLVAVDRWKAWMDCGRSAWDRVLAFQPKQGEKKKEYNKLSILSNRRV